MRRFLIMLFFIAALVSCNKKTATIGEFSVSEYNKVIFAKGNLQYKASTSTWRFAENQYDVVGHQLIGNVYENGVKSNNTRISQDYDGWIDLFGWGTSGYMGRWPFLYEDDSDLYADLKDICQIQYDWGTYNTIGTDDSHDWRTMTANEWDYLLNDRPNAANLMTFALVDKTLGLVLLPDDYWENESSVRLNVTNRDKISNFLNISQWNELEKSGVVFLPCAGMREENELEYYGEEGIYWTATAEDDYDAFALVFDGDIELDEDAGWEYDLDSNDKPCGCSVRLVKDVE